MLKNRTYVSLALLFLGGLPGCTTTMNNGIDYLQRLSGHGPSRSSARMASANSSANSGQAYREFAAASSRTRSPISKPPPRNTPAPVLRYSSPAVQQRAKRQVQTRTTPAPRKKFEPNLDARTHLEFLGRAESNPSKQGNASRLRSRRQKALANALTETTTSPAQTIAKPRISRPSPPRESSSASK